MNWKRLAQASLGMSLAATFLGGCSSALTSSGGERTAREMMNAAIPLVQPAAPETRDPVSEQPAPIDTPTDALTKERSALPEISSNIPVGEAMKVAPFDEPKFFHHFSADGAATVVKYFTYAMYYGIAANDTSYVRQVFTDDCSKCLDMMEWSNQFSKDCPVAETGVLFTKILDVRVANRADQNTLFWVIAKNDEPPIYGYSEDGKLLVTDPPSTSYSQYRIEYVDGTNKITGIYQAPEKYIPESE